jgi:hypothetical protein
MNPAPEPAGRSQHLNASLLLAAAIIFLLGLCVVSVVAGLRLRRAAWDYTNGAHFRGDVGNAFYWGHQSNHFGIFHLYDAVEDGITHNPNRKVDYPPLRLVMASAWTHWAARKYPEATDWEDNYNFTVPLLMANTIAELASCVLIFLLIRLWRRRECAAAKSAGKLVGVWAGVAGALLFWFNPAIIWDGHCWPQWDVWPIPFFLTAVLLASLDTWFIAGICLAIGASLKGQLLLAAPVMLIWPLARGQLGSAFRLTSGFFLATLAIALPWMNPNTPAIVWGCMTLVAIVCVLPIVYEAALPRWAFWGLISIGILLSFPWAATGVPFSARLGPPAWIGILAMTCWLPRRVRFAGVAWTIAVQIALMIPLFHASANWYRFGFEYGTEKFAFMVTGSGAYNVPRMMQVYLQWPHSTDEPVRFLGTTVTFTQATRIIYAFFLILCGIGAAIHDQRRESRFLASMVAPWLLFFVILTQMHGRYTIWAAGISALLAGVGPGMALLGVIVSVVSWLGIVQNQLLFSRDWSPDTLSLLGRADPSLAWILVLAALIYLYYAVMPELRGRCDSKVFYPANTQ